MDARIANLRQEYAKEALDEQSAAEDPVVQFKEWFRQALEAGVTEPNAMILSTATPDGRPSGRTVLLKDVDERGFSFFTNYRSRKSVELSENARAALTFWWPELERQVRVEGSVSRVEESESDSYFATRPRLSQIGAWASAQSEVVAGRTELEESFSRAEQRFTGEVPRPPHWGGYRVSPQMIEMWQGRPGRLHDRIRYVPEEEGWKKERLAP